MDVCIGVVGLGNVGLGALEILAENAGSIREKLGFPLKVKSVCSRSVHQKDLPAFGNEVSPDHQLERGRLRSRSGCCSRS